MHTSILGGEGRTGRLSKQVARANRMGNGWCLGAAKHDLPAVPGASAQRTGQPATLTRQTVLEGQSFRRPEGWLEVGSPWSGWRVTVPDARSRHSRQSRVPPKPYTRENVQTMFAVGSPSPPRPIPMGPSPHSSPVRASPAGLLMSDIRAGFNKKSERALLPVARRWPGSGRAAQPPPPSPPVQATPSGLRPASTSPRQR